MDSLTIEFDEHPSADELRQIVDGVRDYNQSVTGYNRPRSIACFLRGSQRGIIGGACGELWGHSVHISGMWVAESERGKGYGAELLKKVENYAARNGCKLAYLETTSFQARPFYEKSGYRVFGELLGIADGCTMFFMRKDLNRG